MGAQLSSLVKVLVISAVGAALIKYGLPYGFNLAAIAPSNGGALAAILLPAIVMAGLLWWRSTSQTS
ncbi:hypothetical protein FEK30_12175 [Picosynechococcus sp. PCC 11901]|uniref:hypothetical protein n=1 Tax=Picosynechococcus sp. PCC 11901 TaxID=2579791 RepID=UPI0010FBD3D9|nr:hypothetical protein [Picosynechococcus sp. PCC 11901]QCS50123.1 hypothetical protein FEK30_12175 [Picosynechococcus sp. PCC 11901]